jgi:hypothetical protein
MLSHLMLSHLMLSHRMLSHLMLSRLLLSQRSQVPKWNVALRRHVDLKFPLRVRKRVSRMPMGRRHRHARDDRGVCKPPRHRRHDGADAGSGEGDYFLSVARQRPCVQAVLHAALRRVLRAMEGGLSRTSGLCGACPTLRAVSSKKEV